MSAIEASSVQVKTMADGTLRLSVDIEPRHSQAAFALFGAPGTPVAIAALAVASSEPQPEQPKGGPLAKWVAMRCAEFPFQRWLMMTFGKPATEGHESADEVAAITVRSVCMIGSRADLDNDAEAAERFQRLIRKPYAESAR